MKYMQCCEQHARTVQQKRMSRTNQRVAWDGFPRHVVDVVARHINNAKGRHCRSIPVVRFLRSQTIPHTYLARASCSTSMFDNQLQVPTLEVKKFCLSTLCEYSNLPIICEFLSKCSCFSKKITEVFRIPTFLASSFTALHQRSSIKRRRFALACQVKRPACRSTSVCSMVSESLLLLQVSLLRLKLQCFDPRLQDSAERENLRLYLNK